MRRRPPKSQRTDTRFPTTTLFPSQGRARTEQAISVLDGQGYWPMVREIFVQRVERARDGMADEAVIAAALPRAERCLAALAELPGERPCFAGADFSLADAQAAPMFHYFLETQAGGRLQIGRAHV